MREIQDDFDQYLEQGDVLYGREDWDGALRTYDRALRAARDMEDRAEAFCALGDTLLAQARAGDAWHMYAKAVDLDPDGAVGHCGMADVCFERWDLDRALALLRVALARDPELARAHYLMGLVLERFGQAAAARRRFHRAVRLDPDSFALPLQVDGPAFDEALSDALRDVPRDVQQAMADLDLSVEDVPSKDDGRVLREHDIGPMVPGLLLEPEGEGGRPRLVLYRQNLAKVATTREALVEEIRRTIVGELSDDPAVAV